MQRFLDEYIIEEKQLKRAAKTTTPEKKQTKTTHSEASIQLLTNVLDYALNFVKTLPQAQEDMALLHCYWHSLLKLHTHITDAISLLQTKDTIEAGEFHRRTTMTIENILEYLISLEQLKQTYQASPNNKSDPVTELRHAELGYYQHALGLSQNNLNLHFTDSGQQAISSALIVLSIVVQGDVHIFNRSYFEVANFMEEARANGISETTNLEKASIVFADVTQIQALNKHPLKGMKALIIDMTHHPLLDQEELKTFIKKQHERGICVVLVESGLKHQQLGLDKYQTGKITTLYPKVQDAAQTRAYNDLLKPISDDAMHPSIASYLQMVNHICQDKIQAPAVPPTPNAAVPAEKLVLNMRPLGLKKNKNAALVMPQLAPGCKV